MDSSTKQKHIDPHVHCRDWSQSYKATISGVMQIARSQGVVAICDMPNTEPALTTRSRIESRLITAEMQNCLDGYYIWGGATSDPDQLREMASVVQDNDHVVGMKMYAGKSTGDLAIVSEDSQRLVYKTLAAAGYTGVIVVHCEKESLSDYSLWNPRNPGSWGSVKPPEAEVESVRDQIRFAREAGFKGQLHIGHASVPESIRLVDQARKEMRISCEVTPHHLTLSIDSDMMDERGAVYKVNPPIRSAQTAQELTDMLKKGMVDWISTDHAPHAKDEKEFLEGKPAGSYASGIQSLRSYSRFLEGLVSRNGFTEQQIERLTYSNIKKALKIRE
jgi:dihydroorotase